MKSFSWTLALRYLNPLRTFVSVITLISLLGVALGVMVLIVVLSVHNGFERNLKDMLLGFSPHVVAFPNDVQFDHYEERELLFGSRPDAKSAYAYIEGFILVDSKLWQKPASFRAINADNKDQISALEELLDLKNYPESKADMGMEDYVVVSKLMAEAMDLQVGDQIRLIAASNLDQVMAVYSVPDDKAWDLYTDTFEDFEKRIQSLFILEGRNEKANQAKISEALGLITGLLSDENGEASEMRPLEKEILQEIIELLSVFEGRSETENIYLPGTKASIQEKLNYLKELDLEKADNQAFRDIEEFVVPKTLTVYGVYSDTQRSQGPALFLPLHLGQDFKGLEGTVDAVGLVLKDPYRAGQSAAALEKDLGPGWTVYSWMQTHATQFALVKTEKLMISFALSFITLLSAFSITAVMYTVTVQKRQEIGVMKALGARPSQIVRVFLYQGIIVGVAGSLCGLGLGLLAIKFRENIVDFIRIFGVDPFPPEFHGMSTLPAHIVPAQLTTICLVAIVLCIIAALVPALIAAFRDPAKSLRNL